MQRRIHLNLYWSQSVRCSEFHCRWFQEDSFKTDVYLNYDIAVDMLIWELLWY